MGTTADKLARLSETKALLKTRLTEKGVDVASENNFYNLADKVGEISGTKSFTITDIGTSTGFPPQANPGEIVEFESGSKFMTNDVKDELSNDIPVGTKPGSAPRYTLYYFVMPNSNVTVNFS